MKTYHQNTKTVWGKQYNSEVTTGNCRPQQQDRAIFDSKTVGGVHRTNRVIRSNQAMERVGFFETERSNRSRISKR